VIRSRALKAAVVMLTIVLSVDRDARAEWRDDHPVFRAGFISTSGAAYDLERLEPFRAYLESWLPMALELVPMTTYAALVDAQLSDRVQYAIHTASSFATAYVRCGCVDPVAVPAAYDGSKGFYAVLLTRADSDIDLPDQTAGRRLAVAGGDSVAGRLLPLSLLQRDGIDPGDHFSAVVETAGPYAAIVALLAGEADVAVGWSSLSGDAATGYDFGVLADMVRHGDLAMDQVRLIWRSPLIPFGPHVVRADVPPEIRRQIDGALAAMASDNPAALDAVDRASYGGGGFVPVAIGDYASVGDLVGGFPADEPKGSD